MLQAEAKVYSSFGVPAYQEEQRKQRIKRTTKKVNAGRKMLLIGGAILFLYALLLVFLCIKSATLSYQIGSLEQEISQLETNQTRMEYEISQVQSLERIEKVAMKMGLVKPALESSLQIQEENRPIAIAEKSAIDQEHSVGQKVLEKIYTSLFRLAKQTN